MKFITAVVGGYDVHKENVFGLFVKPHNAHLIRGKHTPIRTQSKKKTKINKNVQ